MNAAKASAKPPSTRQRVKHLRVPVLPNEAIEIKNNAANCGLVVAAYLRELGLKYKPASVVDADAVQVLVKVNADQGRLGGLLKMYLSNDERVKGMSKEQKNAAIENLLTDIKTAQAKLLETVQRL